VAFSATAGLLVNYYFFILLCTALHMQSVLPRHIFPGSDTTRPSCLAALLHRGDLDLKPAVNRERNV